MATEHGPKTIIGPVTDLDSYTYGGVAKAADGIAVAAWMATDSNGMWARAIRWDDTLTPILGPLTKFNDPVGATSGDWTQVYSVHPGSTNSVYVAAMDASGSNTFYPAKITVDPTTLALSVSGGPHPSPATPDMINQVGTSWPSEGLLFVNGDDPYDPHTLLVDMDTDSILATYAPPLLVEAMALHEQAGKLLQVCYGNTAAVDLVLVDVTPTGFGTATTVATIAGDELRWGYAAATPDGFVIFLRLGAGTGPAYVYRLTTAGVLTGPHATAVNATGFWDGHHADVAEIGADGNIALATYRDGFLNLLIVPKSGPEEKVTFEPVNTVHTGQTIAVDDGHYVTFCVGTVGAPGNGYGEAVWLTNAAGRPYIRPLRQTQRGDGRGTSTAPRHRQNQSRQASLRNRAFR